MKTFATYAWALLVILMMGLTSCGDDDEIKFTPEQEAYAKKNREYFEMKKLEKDENGELKYKQVQVGNEVALYRITKKENNYTATPTMSTEVELHDLEGKLIDGKVFQAKMSSKFFVNQLIPGLSAVLIQMHADETAEAIIPSSLGYGDKSTMTIQGGSTLIFTFTLYNFF